LDNPPVQPIIGYVISGLLETIFGLLYLLIARPYFTLDWYLNFGLITFFCLVVPSFTIEWIGFAKRQKRLKGNIPVYLDAYAYKETMDFRGAVKISIFSAAMFGAFFGGIFKLDAPHIHKITLVCFTLVSMPVVFMPLWLLATRMEKPEAKEPLPGFKIVSWYGRIGRMEYILTFLVAKLAVILLVLIWNKYLGAVEAHSIQSLGSLIVYSLILLLDWIVLAAIAKRARDAGLKAGLGYALLAFFALEMVVGLTTKVSGLGGNLFFLYLLPAMQPSKQPDVQVAVEPPKTDPAV